EKIIGWGGSLDFIISRWSDPGWVGTTLRFVAVNSYYFGFVLMAVGLAFIVWNERRRTDRLYGPLKDQLENAPDFAAMFTEAVNELPPVPGSGGDTLVATGTVSDPPPGVALERLLHVCYILAGVGKLKDGEFIELTIVAYNASPKTLALADVRGNARCTMIEGDREIAEKLGVPDLIRIAPKRQIPPFSEFVMTLHQVVSARQALLILGTMRKKTVTFDLRELQLEFEPYQEPGPRARLQLWDGVTIGDKSGVRFGRVTMMSTGPATG
ncbi:MAG: hypothetical protein ACJ8E3_04575, partial [Sphingomicrobium sp.]